MTSNTVLCIVGPTASGKTALSVAAAERFHGEIVSADAVSVYRGLDIGSAKPTLSERRGIPHHLIDCVDISDRSFSVSAFRSLARDAIDGILARRKLPIVVGGSGLYADAVFADMGFSVPSDSTVRAALEDAYDQDPNDVFARLRACDPNAASRLHPNDKKRVVRALEVFVITGRSFSDWNREFETAQKNDGTYRTVKIGLQLPRDVLYDRINRRVDLMMREGLKAEAFQLFDQGYTPDRYTAMHSIGYTQLYELFCGRCTETEAIDAVKLATRRFAKRQMTWFRRDTHTVWMNPQELSLSQMLEQIEELL